MTDKNCLRNEVIAPTAAIIAIMMQLRLKLAVSAFVWNWIKSPNILDTKIAITGKARVSTIMNIQLIVNRNLYPHM